MIDYEEIYQKYRSVLDVINTVEKQVDEMDGQIFNMTGDEPNYNELIQKCDEMSNDLDDLYEARDIYKNFLSAMEQFNDDEINLGTCLEKWGI